MENTDELATLRARVKELEESREAWKRSHEARQDQCDTLRAENARLREALERIANYEESMMRWQDIALAALTAKEPAR